MGVHQSKSLSPLASPEFTVPFNLLSDEIVLEILSYISNAPFELSETNPKSTLTHTFPLVSKQFQTIVSTEIDTLWIPSLVRLVSRNPHPWMFAFSHMLNVGTMLRPPSPPWSELYNPEIDKNHFMLGAKVQQMDSLGKDELSLLLTEIYNSVEIPCMKSSDDTKNSNSERYTTDANNHDERVEERTSKNAKDFYMYMIRNYMQTSLPIFYLHSLSLLNHLQSKSKTMTLNLFETRYRHMFTELMEQRQSKANDFKKGGRLRLEQPRPKFIIVNGHGLVDDKYGFVVEIVQCKMLSSGVQIWIDVLMKVPIFEIKQREDSGIGLSDAYIRKFY